MSEIIRIADKKDIPFLKELYRVCFPGDEEFSRFFFKEIADPGNVLLCETDGVPSGAVHMLPVTLECGADSIPGTYIFAAGVLPSFRSRGIMKRLLFRSFDVGSARGEEFSALMTQEDDPAFALEKLRVLIDALMSNREMQVEVAAFAITILVVYIIRRLPVDHCWTIAMITGMLIDIVVILVGDLRFETRISIAGLIVGSIVALIVAIILKFFIFNVDYSRTERVQFEDDEYYYYVKAVPKNTVSLTEKKVKKIKGSEKSTPAAEEPDITADRAQLDAPEYRVRRSGSTAGNKNRTRRINIPEGTKNT